MPSCETCHWWIRPDQDGWSECKLTGPDSHETLVRQVVYTRKGDEWHPLKPSDRITAILHVRRDFMCNQFDPIDIESEF